MKRLLLAVGLTVMMMFLMAPVVNADVYYFDQIGAWNNAGPSPYGSVTLTQVGSDVTISVALNNSLEFVKTGFDYNFFFNASGVSTGDLTATGAFAGLLSFAGSSGSFGLSADGSGSWDFGVVLTGEANGAPGAYTGPLTFTVHNALLSELEIANADGNLFAADVYNPNQGTNNTGMIWVGNTPQVPEPATMMLLGIGLVGLAGVGRKLRK